MILVKEAFGASETTDIFRTNINGTLWVWLKDGGGSGWNSGTITLKIAETDTLADAGTFVTFAPDGTDATFTDDGMHKYEVPGAYFQFTADASISNVDIYVDGSAVVVQA